MNEQQTLNLLLFTLYKTKKLPENLCKLAFLLDMDSFLNLCGYYGGRTIQIPKLKDVDCTMKALKLYELTKFKGMSWDNAMDEIGGFQLKYKQIKKEYDRICKAMEGVNLGL